jgi:hypothetical protein
MVDGPISIYIFWPKTPGQRARHEQGALSWCKIQASDQSSGLLRRTASRNLANISK